MDRDSQFLRWGLPGSIFCMVILSYWSVHSSFSMELILGDGSVGAWLFASIIGLSIPIGYVIYQIYFVFRWWCMDDYDLIKQTIDGIENLELNDREDIIGNIFGFVKPKIQAKKWPFIEAYWYKNVVINNSIKSEILILRYQHLISTFHSLGATMASIIIGHISSGLLFFIYFESSINRENFFKGLLIFAIWVLVLFYFYINRRYVRANSIVFQNQLLIKLQEKDQERG